jgi:rhodanese-related sulfurtransferase
MAREYSTEELHRKLFESGERFYLIDTLPHASYVNRHLPGALSLPFEDLADHAEAVIPDKGAEVVAYCSSPH